MREATNRNDILKIRKYIDENLGNYKFDIPDYSKYEFDLEEFGNPFEIPKDNIDYIYTSDNKAINEGLRYFEETYYNQHEVFRKSILTKYKNKQLSPYVGFKEEKGNYYYDTNKKIESILNEAYTMAKEATNDKINLPDDFFKFNQSYDYSACHRLADLEVHLSHKTKGVKLVGDYYAYVDYDLHGNKYGYKVQDCIKKFRQDLLSDLKIYVELNVESLVQETLMEYTKASEQELYDKIEIFKNALRNFLDFSKNSGQDIPALLSNLVKDLKRSRLKRESFYKKQDDYGKSENSYGRYKSESDAKNAGDARIAAYKKDCDNYVFSTLPHILSFAYNIQIKNIVYNFKAELQNIFDNHGIAYPKLEDWVAYENNSRSNFRLGLSNYSLHSPLLTLAGMNNIIKVSASSSNVKGYTTDLTKSEIVHASIMKSISGYKEANSYNYTVSLRPIAYDAACEDVCTKSYESAEKILNDIILNIEKIIVSLPREIFEKQATKSFSKPFQENILSSGSQVQKRDGVIFDTRSLAELTTGLMSEIKK